jgi:hypothetical protein
MRHINLSAELKDRILVLENKRNAELNLLKAQLRQTAESLKPSNLIKGVISESEHSPGIMDKLFSALAGLLAGYLAKKVVTGESRNLLKKIFGMAVQLFVANLVSRNSEFIKAAGRSLVKKGFGKSRVPAG